MVRGRIAIILFKAKVSVRDAVGKQSIISGFSPDAACGLYQKQNRALIEDPRGLLGVRPGPVASYAAME